MHLHIPYHKLNISEKESFHSRRETPNIRYTNDGKDKVHSKQSDTNRQESTTLDSRGKNNEVDNDDFGLYLLAAEIVDEFEERLEWLQK